MEVLVQVADFYKKAEVTEAVAGCARRAHPPTDLRTLFHRRRAGAREEPRRAEAVFREALAVQPDSAPILNYLGYMNADRGVRLEEALAYLEKAVSLDPENGVYLDSLGWALYRLDRLERAEAQLRKAVSKIGTNGVVLDHLADVLKRRGAVREALDYWRRALEGDDEGDELDRTVVQRKIREAQAGLDAAQNKQRP